MRPLKLPRRLATRFASLGARPNALIWQPEPPDTGQSSAAHRMAGGVWLLEGRLVESGAQSPWDIKAPDSTWQNALHGQGWLDDAAASNDPQVWKMLSRHVWSWLDRYGDGKGPGWSPEIVARRLIRWIAYSARLLQGTEREQSEAFFHALGMQTKFLGWRWRETRKGVERIEALTGLLYAILSLEGTGARTEKAISQVGAVAARIVQADGSIGSRNPEELARVLALLVWSEETLTSAGLKASTDHLVAIQRAALVVRMLTHSSDTLPRFHGGRSGGNLPLAKLNSTSVKYQPVRDDLALGFVRMTAGETRLLMDAAQVPTGPHAATGHSSALAFELHDGIQPIVVNCGSGSGFGPSVALAARRSEAHSTIELDGRGAGQLTESNGPGAPAILSVSGAVSCRFNNDESGQWALAESKHYVARLGLHLERRLHLSKDGTCISGEDTALAIDAKSRARVNTQNPETRDAFPMVARFHLHPDVAAVPAFSGRGIALTLKDGTLWVFRCDTEAVELQPSAYFDEQRPKPRATSQIVATTRILDYWGRITWSLERLRDQSGI